MNPRLQIRLSKIMSASNGTNICFTIKHNFTDNPSAFFFLHVLHLTVPVTHNGRARFVCRYVNGR